MRQRILETIIATLEPKDFVLALWQGGSAAHKSTDEWSDIDIQVIVEDERFQEIIAVDAPHPLLQSLLSKRSHECAV